MLKPILGYEDFIKTQCINLITKIDKCCGLYYLIAQTSKVLDL